MDRRNSGELVAAHIRRLVVDGAYLPGERIRQDEIAADLGVSRIPVREAIIALDREGWVRVEPHRGAFVNGLDADFILDHFELHGEIVGLLARRVIERADDDQLQTVVDAAARVAAWDGTDTAEFNEVVYGWVEALDREAAAPRLASITRVMSNLFPGNFFAEVPDAVAIQREGVGALGLAIEARDPDRALAEAELLLRRHGAAITALLDERGVLGPSPSAAADAADGGG
jgi:DNA-binding GntR family transcriptional regulator